MAGPEGAQEAVETFNKRLDAVQAREVNALASAYAPVNSAARKNAAALAKVAKAKDLKPWQVMRLGMMKDLEKQVAGEMKQFTDIATAQITQGQAAAVVLSQEMTEAAMAAGLPPGITPNMLARQGVTWSRLPREAFANFVGISADGAPLGKLLEPLGPDTVRAVREGVGEGIALGYSPRKTADLVSLKSGMGLTRALAISRTETLRAHREASRLQYAANPDLIKGYRRMAAKDDRVCMACIVLDGNLYGNDQALDAHVNCRCAIVPEMVTYGDLGMTIPEPPKPEGALGWFNSQSPAVQKKMMGAGKYKAFNAGAIDYFDFVKKTRHPVWGTTAVVTPIKEIVTDMGGPLTQWLAHEAAKEAAIKVATKKTIKKAKPKLPSTEAEVIPKRREVTNVSSRFKGPADDLAKWEDAPDDLSRVSNVQILNATPEGQELGIAIESWASGGNEAHRRGATKWLSGSNDLIEEGERLGAQIAEAVSVSPPLNVKTHRGFIFNGKSIDEVEEIYKVGAKTDVQISSFSIDTDIAERFAGRGIDAANNTSVVLNVEPGAKGLNVSPVSRYLSEKERILHGRFEVIKVHREIGGYSPKDMLGKPVPNVLHVDIRQINNFVREGR